jgi:hypothetical protein
VSCVGGGAVPRSFRTVRSGKKLIAVSAVSCCTVPHGECKVAEELWVGSLIGKIANAINLKLKVTRFDRWSRYMDIIKQNFQAFPKYQKISSRQAKIISCPQRTINQIQT